MKTCGYDMLLELDEKLLNKALAVVFYTGMLKASGSYSFVDGIPEELQGFTKIKYKVRLKNEPYVDLKETDKVFLKLSVELFLTVLTSVEVELDVDFHALADIRYDMANKKVTYDLSMAEITGITINNMLKINQNAIEQMNGIIKIILSKFLTEDIKKIDIPLAMYNLELPEMPEGDKYKLPVKVADVRILDSKLLAVGINLFDHSGGDLSSARDYTNGSEFFIVLKEETLKEIYDFWWANTNLALKRSFSGEKILNMNEKIGKGIDILTRLVTLGFIETTSEVKEAVLKYQGSVEVLEKPEFDFVEGGKVMITKLKMKATFSSYIDARIDKKISLDTSSFIPDKVTSWNDDIKLGQNEKQKKLLPLNEEAVIELTDAGGIITTNEKNNIVINIEKADLNLDLGGKWYQALSGKLLNRLLDLFENNIISQIPDLVISPALVTSSVNVLGYTFGVILDNIAFDNDELSLNANICINELAKGNIPVPLYIANKKSRKLHRFDCEAIDDIDFENRRGYHVYDEAIRDGYKPCGMCLDK
jgi:hypothetical protein